MEADLQSRIEQALLAKDYAAVRQLLRNRPAPALTEGIRALPIEQQVVVFRILPRHLAGRAFEFLDLSHQEPLLLCGSGVRAARVTSYPRWLA